MKKIVHTRLDEQTEKTLSRLMKKLNMSQSAVIRKALNHYAQNLLPKKKRKIIGLGEFRSDVHDLASNKKHLKGFGQ